MNRSVRAVALAAIAVLALAIGGCGSRTASGAGTDVLRIGNFQDVTSWDPANADIGFDGPYLSAVYDPLVSLDADSNPVPALATSWHWSDGKRTLTMTLRTGVTFSDGTTFGAKAAVLNLKHLKSGTRSAPTYRNVESFGIVDPSTIRINLKRRDDALLYFMGLGRSWMASPTAIKKGTLATAPVGSGPYLLQRAGSRKGAEYVFAKKDHYWNAGQYPFPKVKIFPITNTTASLNAMVSGQINVEYGNVQNLPRAKQNGWNIAKNPAMWIGIQFADHDGSQLPPLKHKKVRQAISYAFNAAGLLSTMPVTGAGVLTNQIFPAGSPVYQPELNDRYSHDMAKARTLLAKAGYPNGFSVTMPMSPTYQAWQPAAMQTFQRLGLDVTWDNMTYARYFIKASSYPMYIAAISMDSDPMGTLVDQLTTPQWFNPRPSLDAYPELSTLVNQVRHAYGKQQLRLLRKLNSTLVDMAWWDVWYQSNNVYFSKKGITVTPITGMMFPTLKFIQRS